MRQKSVKIGSSSSHFGCNSSPGLGWGDCTWVLWIHPSFLLRLAGASLRQAFGLPQWEGACLALSNHIPHTGFVCGGRLRQASVCPRDCVQQWETGLK